MIRREADLSGHGLPPGRLRIISPYDTDARYSEKRGTGWDGYKIHLTETCGGPAGSVEPDHQCGHHHGAVADAAMTKPVHDMLAAAGLVPGEHAADAGLRRRGPAAGRPPGSPGWPRCADDSPQARTGGYTADVFTIDWDHQRVTCPQGALSHRGHPPCRTVNVSRRQRFPAAACRACPARGECTTSARRGRQLGVRPRHIHEALTAARAEQADQPWKDRYQIRAGVEGTIRQVTAVTGIRTARYLGLPKTSLEHAAAAAAINLTRLNAWWTSNPYDAPERPT